MPTDLLIPLLPILRKNAKFDSDIWQKKTMLIPSEKKFFYVGFLQMWRKEHLKTAHELKAENTLSASADRVQGSLKANHY